jgi:hypothetical protein
VGHDDFGGLGGGDGRVEHLDDGEADDPAEDLGGDERRGGGGAMPAKVLDSMRPTVMAGLAKLVELVKK